ncbi:hypothetical protein Nepgr_026663 [Nepenthes gracilis]|uniref:Uncharacterized protein n=1 Tax=Nepenthes gracilis TaxID=150966 RepID=A0AAD3T886_NEPGR|nr:hypothetical protein Nepgr_026663 [Nepenthes gracilis]
MGSSMSACLSCKMSMISHNFFVLASTNLWEFLLFFDAHDFGDASNDSLLMMESEASPSSDCPLEDGLFGAILGVIVFGPSSLAVYIKWLLGVRPTRAGAGGLLLPGACG